MTCSQGARLEEPSLDPADVVAPPRRVVLFIDDPDATAVSYEGRLRSDYGLTRAQARLASEVARGQSLSEAAEVLGTTMNTAKTHLTAILDKTDTRRQTDLGRVVSLGLARVCRP